MYPKSSDDPLDDTVKYCGSFEHSTTLSSAAWYSCRHDGLDTVTLHGLHQALQELSAMVSYPNRTVTLPLMMPAVVKSAPRDCWPTVVVASCDPSKPASVPTTLTLPSSTAHRTSAVASSLHPVDKRITNTHHSHASPTITHGVPRGSADPTLTHTQSLAKLDENTVKDQSKATYHWVLHGDCTAQYIWSNKDSYTTPPLHVMFCSYCLG